jgi:Family of unknown function (DUF5990)
VPCAVTGWPSTETTAAAGEGRARPTACDDGRVLIRIESFDLPGLSCGPGPDFPGGHHNIHVAVQGRKGQQDLLGPVPADVASAVWDLECHIVSLPPDMDLRGPQIHGSPGKRFIYITWGVVEPSKPFRMFRRAKLWLDAVPEDVMGAACECGLLVGRLGLTDEAGWPLCASVRPPRIEWSAEGS